MNFEELEDFEYQRLPALNFLSIGKGEFSDSPIFPMPGLGKGYFREYLGFAISLKKFAPSRLSGLNFVTMESSKTNQRTLLVSWPAEQENQFWSVFNLQNPQYLQNWA